MNVIQVEFSPTAEKNGSVIPDWIKNNAKWWSEKQISDEDFLTGIQYLVENGLVSVKNPLAEEIEQQLT